MLTRLASFCASIFLGIACAHAVPVTVTLTGLGFSDGRLALDFIDGGPPDNSITITHASLSSGTADIRTGGVVGSLDSTLILNDSVFFTEFSTAYSGIDQISFQFDATTNGPAGGSLPDSFSVFLLRSDDPTLTLFHTSDPTGADALLQFSINGTSNGKLSIYQDISTDHPPVQVRIGTIPEPNILWVFALAAITGLASYRRFPIR